MQVMISAFLCSVVHIAFRGLVAGTDTISQILSRVKAEQDTLRDAISTYLSCVVDSKKAASPQSSPKLSTYIFV